MALHTQIHALTGVDSLSKGQPTHSGGLPCPAHTLVGATTAEATLTPQGWVALPTQIHALAENVWQDLFPPFHRPP